MLLYSLSVEECHYPIQIFQKVFRTCSRKHSMTLSDCWSFLLGYAGTNRKRDHHLILPAYEIRDAIWLIAQQALPEKKKIPG